MTRREERNRDHIYCNQVQEEMAAADLQWADFVVWTLKEIQVVHMEEDPHWKDIHLPKLNHFQLNELMQRFKSSIE